MNWKQVAVSDVAKPILGGTPKRSISEYWGGDIKWASAKDISQTKTRYISKTEESITSKGVEKSAVKVLPANTIVITSRGTVGEICLLKEPMAFNQSCYGLISDGHVDQLYLYYSLIYITKKIKNYSYGTVFDTITKNTFDKLFIPVPRMKEQKKIVSILGALDEKIELNIKMNHTLEETAMALYKHWFVDFGPFQDCEFVESELGMIPKGWEVRKVLDLGEIITGKTPSTKKKEYYGNDVPFIKIPDMHNQVYTTETETMLSTTGADTQKKKYLPENSVCVSCIATPGLVCLTDRLSQTNQQINSVICKDGISSYFTYLFFRNISSNIISLGSGGTATLNLNKKDFSNIKLVVPDKETMSKFNEKVQSLFDFIRVNQNEVETLTQARDYLLPKLLSGEIDLSEAEETVENAVQ